MKKFLSLILALALCLGLSVPAVAIPKHQDVDYSSMLDEYMEQMDGIYVQTDTAQKALAQNGSTDCSYEWETQITKWADELGITIISQDSTYTLKAVLSEDPTQAKLLVYIWTTLEYENSGEHGERFTMGFGRDHILNIAIESNGLTVIEDSFVDNLLNFSHGNADDCELLSMKDESQTDASQQIQVNHTAEISRANAAYSPSAAVAYSEKWVGHKNTGSSVSMNPSSYNPEYYYYSADCANFVSQCMLAGGMSQGGNWNVTKNTGSKTPTIDSDYSKSGIAWRSVKYFKSYWEGKGYSCIPVTSSSKAAAGNPIFSSGHLMFIVDVDSKGRIVFNAHNDDAYHCLLSPSSAYNTFELTHNYSYTCTDTTHTRVCSICGDTQATQAHIWKLSGGIYTCTVCGFKTTKIPGTVR